jgi:hypothetical protein
LSGYHIVLLFICYLVKMGIRLFDEMC